MVGRTRVGPWLTGGARDPEEGVRGGFALPLPWGAVLDTRRSPRPLRVQSRSRGGAGAGMGRGDGV